MTLLMMLSVILLSMPMILLSSLNVIYETLWTGAGRALLISILEKTQLVLFDQSNNTSAIDVKMDWSVLEEKSSFKMLGLTFSSKLDWGSYLFRDWPVSLKIYQAVMHGILLSCLGCCS